MTHRYHPRPDTDDPTEALLWDDCTRCDQQAADPRGLDGVKLAKAWRLMLDVEVKGNVPAYKTRNERKLSGVLYMMYVLIERMPSVRLDRP